MLTRYLIIGATAFVLGFGIATYWQSTLRDLDTATRDLGDAKAEVKAHEKNGELAGTINTIESTGVKENQHASDETDRIGRDLATGTVRLQLNASCPELPQAATRSSVANAAGAGSDPAPRQHREAQPAPQLNRAAEPDYLALREGIRRCRTKVTALQGILEEERNLGRD